MLLKSNSKSATADYAVALLTNCSIWRRLIQGGGRATLGCLLIDFDQLITLFCLAND